MAARAAPDGYTMLLGATSITYLQSIYPSAGFDFARDFAPISGLARIQLALVVNRERLDVSTMAQFIEAARHKPDSIEIGSPDCSRIIPFRLHPPSSPPTKPPFFKKRLPEPNGNS